MGFAESPRSIIIVGGPIKYFTEYSSTNLYVEKTFGGTCHTLTILNDHATDPIQFSHDGITLHGILKGGTPGESITVNVGGTTSIWLKSTAGTATIRVWAY